MSQIIQHNIMSLNAFNCLSTNNNMLSKNLEKLASGYKINRAADDAAGLAISQKMRAQITGLERAADNAQDGISLVQTAEGALNEVHAMLDRMVELATQAANGTYTTNDRQNLQSELDALKDEVDRIATETNFNGIKLLDGTTAYASVTNDTIGTSKVKIAISDQTAVPAATYTFNFGNIIVDSNPDTGMYVTEDEGICVQLFTDGVFTVTLNNTTGTTYTPEEITAAVRAAVLADQTEAQPQNKLFTEEEAKVISSFKMSGDDIAVPVGYTFNHPATSFAANRDGAGALRLQIGDTASQNISVSIEDMGTDSLGIDEIEITSEQEASAAIDLIKNAVDSVSDQRAELGAIQNRLEYTINNLTSTTENLTSSESRIRDTDMAKEMMKYTKNNILAQAAQSMLAQANQQPQQVLQLLQ